MQNITVKFVWTILFSVIVFSFSAHAQKAELVVQTGHSERVQAMAFSPNGRILASGSDDFTIKLWDVESGKELKTLVGQRGDVLSVKFSPDEKLIAASIKDQEVIKIWEVNSGKELRTIQGVTGEVYDIDFAPDGNSIISASGNGTIKLWNVLTGQETKTFQTEDEGGSVLAIALSANGNILATSSIGEVNGQGYSFITLWDIQTGKKRKSLEYKSGGEVEALMFTADSQKLLCIDDEIRTWDVNSGIQIASVQIESPGEEGGIVEATFNSIHKVAAIGRAGGLEKIRLVDTTSGKTLKTLENTDEDEDFEVVESFEFSPNGRILASGDKAGKITLWNTETGKIITILKHYLSSSMSVEFSPDGKFLANGSADHTVKLWNFTTGKLTVLSGHSETVNSVAFSPDGKILASGSTDKTIKLWDTATAKEIRVLVSSDSSSDEVGRIVFSSDGSKLVSLESNVIRLWDISSGKELKVLKFSAENSFSVSISPDTKKIAISNDNSIGLWDLTKDDGLQTFGKHSGLVTAVAFSSDGKSLVSSSADHSIKFWSVETGNVLKTLMGHSDSVYSIALGPEKANLLASSAIDKTIRIWNSSTGQQLRVIHLDSDMIVSIAFSPDGKTLAGVGVSGRVYLWDVLSGVNYVSLFSLTENDWAIITPSGLLDASPNARKLMNYVVGLEPVSLEQMKDGYYVPGLLQKIFRGEPLPNIELFSKQDLFPRIEYEPLKPGQKLLNVKLTNRSGGIGQVQVLVNGKEFIKDARPAGFNSSSPSAAITVDLTNASIKLGKENKIEIVASNATGSLSTRGTRGAEIIYSDSGKKQTETPNIYVVVGGISNYTGDNLKLNYAAKDAEDFARAIELGATKLVGDKSKVHIRLLTSNGDRSGAKLISPDAKISTATKADFQHAFDDFTNATSNDVFIVYLAGHGVSLNLNQNPNQAGGDTYLYLTQEATTTDKSVLAIENSRRAMALSSDEIKDLMKQNKALKQVLILDTCAAGALSNSLTGKRDLPSDQIRAIERLKDSTGFFVLMGASADAVSYEASQYGQGLLTYALLQGMKGARLRENQYADIGMLFGYAQEAVPNMAKNIGGIQQPLIITPNSSNSFDIGKFTAEEQKQIVLSSPKPVILRPIVRNSAVRFDNLKLTQMMAEQLRQVSSGLNQIVFVDAEEMTDSIQPVGDYSIESDTLKISVILVKNNSPLGNEITVKGNMNEPQKVIRQLVEAIMRSLRPMM